jgi:hypothetical protein
MDCAKLYLTCAEECLRMSKKTRSPEVSERWFGLAEKWVALAEALIQSDPADRGEDSPEFVPATSH